ncbi:hypothetical protein ACIQGW_03805 [Lysinibacillus xylanilyticus]|uniref:hypothetical protein n=1 Tax=Lysinibacillus xylanilyticus TaxID=582475 RepID=UPI003805BECB
MFDKKKSIFNYLFNLQSVFAALIVLTLIYFNKNNSIIYIELLFKEMREGTLYQTIDKNLVSFINGENIEFINKSINLLNEIALFLIVILVAYYTLYFTKQYLAEKGNTNKLYFLVLFIFKDKLILSRDKEGAIKLVNYVFKVILINLPFIIGLILYNNNDIKLLFFIGIVSVYLVFEKIKFKQIQKMCYLNIVISFILNIVIILNSIISIKDLLSVEVLKSILKLFTSTYSVVSLTTLLLYILFFLIRIEYNIARISKRYICIDFSKINFKSKEKFNEDLLIEFKNRETIKKSKRMKKRKELLYIRNLENLVISIYLTIYLTLLIFLCAVFNLESINSLLITSFLFIFIRFLTRGYEIIKAFFKDATSNDLKLSSLTYIDRIKLVIKSLFEIAIYSTLLKAIYFSLNNGLELSSKTIKDTVSFLFESFSIQIFNVSYSIENGLLFAIIHIVQILISACLILLCIALYSGRSVATSFYYIEKISNNIYYLYEELSGNGQTTAKRILQFNSIGKLNELWGKDDLSSDLYNVAIQEYENHKLWIQENKELKEEILYIKR